MILKFDEVAVDEHFEKLSFSIPQGVFCKIIAYSEDVKNLILDLILGFSAPSQGEIRIFDENPAQLRSEQIYELRQKCGVVLSGGGLISNLKLRENLALPLTYHTLMSNSEMENSLGHALELTGLVFGHEKDFDEYFGKLPGLLSLYEKKMVALTRVFAFNPDLMLYDSLAEGIGHESAKKILKITEIFHRQKPDRTSVYLTVNEDTMEPIKTPWVIKVM